jgi:hypothetical protein
MILGPRKFYKMNGLNFIFKTYDDNDIEEAPGVLYNTTVDGFNNTFVVNYVQTNKINQHTILFITANAADDGRFIRVQTKNGATPPTVESEMYVKIHTGDTMIWARGDIYCVSTKTVIKESFDRDTQVLSIEYSDGTTETLDLSNSFLSGTFPINVDQETKTVSLKDLYYDTNGNLVTYSDFSRQDRNVLDNIRSLKNVHIEGIGNKATTNYQHIEGRYAKVDNTYIFMIGDGTSGAPSNIFTITFNGVAHLKNDVTAGGTDANPAFKLSDIHSVINEDWCFLGDKYNDYNAD